MAQEVQTFLMRWFTLRKCHWRPYTLPNLRVGSRAPEVSNFGLTGWLWQQIAQVTKIRSVRESVELEGLHVIDGHQQVSNSWLSCEMRLFLNLAILRSILYRPHSLRRQQAEWVWQKGIKPHQIFIIGSRKGQGLCQGLTLLKPIDGGKAA